MPCPTCDHTMQPAARDENGVTVHWCPRCGTLRLTTPRGHVNDEPPKLVARCREFEKQTADLDPPILGDWRRLGIAESINPPADRP